MTQLSRLQVEVTKSGEPPYGAMMRSPAVWSLILMHFGSNFITIALTTYLPTYFQTVDGYGMTLSGQLTALQAVLAMCISMSGARFADYLIAHHLTVRQTRIGVMGTVLLGVSLGLLLPHYIYAENSYIGAGLVVLAVALLPFGNGSMNPNYNEISPHWGPLLFTIGNSVSNLSGVFSMSITGWMLGDNKDSTGEDWQKVFFLYVGQACCFFALFVAFMEGNPIQALN